MELPIIPLLIGGVVIMSIISWAEDHLKDNKKKTYCTERYLSRYYGCQ